jgi:hypothetical protein
MKKYFLLIFCLFTFSCNAAQEIKLDPIHLWHTVSLRKIKKGKIVPTFLAEYLLKTPIDARIGKTRPVKVVCMFTGTEMNLLIPLNEWNKFTQNEIERYFPEVKVKKIHGGSRLSPIHNYSIVTIDLTHKLKALLNKEKRKIDESAREKRKLTRDQRIKEIEGQLTHLALA